jgi:hypothetical protein
MAGKGSLQPEIVVAILELAGAAIGSGRIDATKSPVN